MSKVYFINGTTNDFNYKLNGFPTDNFKTLKQGNRNLLDLLLVTPMASNEFTTRAQYDKFVPSGIINDFQLTNTVGNPPLHYDLKIQGNQNNDYYFYVFDDRILGSTEDGLTAIFKPVA